MPWERTVPELADVEPAYLEPASFERSDPEPGTARDWPADADPEDQESAGFQAATANVWAGYPDLADADRQDQRSPDYERATADAWPGGPEPGDFERATPDARADRRRLDDPSSVQPTRMASNPSPTRSSATPRAPIRGSLASAQQIRGSSTPGRPALARPMPSGTIQWRWDRRSIRDRSGRGRGGARSGRSRPGTNIRRRFPRAGLAGRRRAGTAGRAGRARPAGARFRQPDRALQRGRARRRDARLGRRGVVQRAR